MTSIKQPKDVLYTPPLLLMSSFDTTHYARYQWKYITENQMCKYERHESKQQIVYSTNRSEANEVVWVIQQDILLSNVPSHFHFITQSTLNVSLNQTAMTTKNPLCLHNLLKLDFSWSTVHYCFIHCMLVRICING